MNDRAELIASLERLLEYGAAVHAPTPILSSIVRLIKAAYSYDPANRTMEWHPDNLRYEESLLGERNMYVYIMHLWTVEPPWVGVEILDSKQDQHTNALDIRIVDRKDYPETEQCKTGHLGKSDDLYVHKDWLKGTPDNIVAVCTDPGRNVIYGGPTAAWKQTYKEGAESIKDKVKWMYPSYFKECGGWVIDICEDVRKII